MDDRNAIVGHWVGEARQAIFGETPIRAINRGQVADLYIYSDGTAQTIRKALFSTKKETYIWKYDSMYDCFPFMYDSTLTNSQELFFTAIVDNDKLCTVFPKNGVPGMSESALYYRKV